MGFQQKDLVSFSAGQNHALGQAELHLPWFQVGHHNSVHANQFLWVIGGLDAGEHGTGFLFAGGIWSQAKGQFQKLVSAFNVFSVDNLDDAQVYFSEIGKFNFCTDGIFAQRLF